MSTTSSTDTTSTSSSTTSSSTTSSTSSTTTSASTTTTSAACATSGPYQINAFGSGDTTVDGKYARIQPFLGSGYRVTLDASLTNAQKFNLACDGTLLTAGTNLQAMVGGTSNLHSVFFFPSTAAASALVGVNWELFCCTGSVGTLLSCTAMGQSVFQIQPGDPTLQLGNQNYGETVTLRLLPAPT